MLETELSAHTHALRTLARLLVGDGAAEDLVQDTALVALRSPPAEISGLRGWLSQVLRRLARNHKRGEARRQRRERQTAPRPLEDAAARVAEHHEAVHRMTATLFDLPEPYHSTLLLRFFEELTPTAIAEQTGVPLATVKSRLKRGLKLLRERLDEQVKGEDWRPVLAVTFGLPHAGKAATAATATVTTVTTGILAMATTAKFSITVVAAAVAVAACLWFCRDPAPASVAERAVFAPAEVATGTALVVPRAPAAVPLLDRSEVTPEHPSVTGALTSAETVSSHGALPPDLKATVARSLNNSIVRVTKKLDTLIAAGDDIVRQAQLTRALETRKAQLTILMEDRYVLLDPGAVHEIWPASPKGFRIVTHDTLKLPSGKLADVVMAIEIAKFPGLASASEYLSIARYSDGVEAADRFNGMPDPVRREAIEAQRLSVDDLANRESSVRTGVYLIRRARLAGMAVNSRLWILNRSPRRR